MQGQLIIMVLIQIGGMGVDHSSFCHCNSFGEKDRSDAEKYDAGINFRDTGRRNCKADRIYSAGDAGDRASRSNLHGACIL